MLQRAAKGKFTFSADLIEIHNDVSLVCNSNISKYNNLCFTIDTGATHSIIKRSKIKHGSKVTKDSTLFNGLVENQPFRSLAKIRMSLLIEGVELEHTFYVVPDKINLRNDGIIGTCFLKEFQSSIDYSKNKIKFRINIPIKQILSSQSPINKDKISANAHSKNGGKHAKYKNKDTHNKLNVTDKTNLSSEVNETARIKRTHDKLNPTRDITMSNESNERSKNANESSKRAPENRLEEPNKNIEKKVTFKDKNEHFIYHNQPTSLQTNSKTPTKPKTKINNPDFYKNLPIEYFNKYRKMKLHPIGPEHEPHEIKEHKDLTERYIQTASETLQHGKLKYEKEMKKKQIHIMKQVALEPSPIENPIDRLTYLSEHINFSHCSPIEKQRLLECFQQHNRAFQIP